VSALATSDSQAIALLCAPLNVGDAKPLSVTEWAGLAASIHESEIGRPAGLVGMAAEDLATTLVIESALAERVARLMDRGGPFAFELERLADRGIWLTTRADDDYPVRLRQRLGLRAPPVLFGAGSRGLLGERAVAVVGSRAADDAVIEVTEAIGRQLGREQVVVVSGAARGVDRAAMDACTSAGGVAGGFLADNLLRLTQQRDSRQLLADNQLVLLTPFAPDARFMVGNAMSRNKLIYCAAEAAIVVATNQGSGGTWSGAVEALKAGWIPVWAWGGTSAPPGNQALEAAGALRLDEQLLDAASLFDTLCSSTQATRLPADELLQAFLESARTEAELSDHFGLERTQVRAWMKRCVDSGWVVKKQKPARFELAPATAPTQPQLFDEH
jgi:predicted Rossmann fold nucleotide-binding protein DprA/Smf involved in DNA uptake